MFPDYEDNWLIVEETKNTINYSLSDKIIERILLEYKDWTLPKLYNNFDNALQRLKVHAGDNIYVALSGGIDSQYACLSLKRAEIPFKAITMVMDDNFNQPDVNSARKFCKKHNIIHEEINVDILNFLTTKLNDYSLEYECPSPQFCSHFFFFEQLLNRDPSCIIIGGSYPKIKNNKWKYDLTKSQISWRIFKHKNQCNMIGDFTSYSFDFSLLCMMTIIQDSNGEESEETLNYKIKVDHFKNLNKGITPQYAKLTGFERLKSHFNKIHNNHGVFNNLFRKTLEKIVPNKPGKLLIPTEIQECLFKAIRNINTL